MAEFTKDIQTLTQQAGTSPQLQTNTGSLATDVISAASFGLGLYRQNKAATELAGAQQQQADYQTRLSEGIMAYRTQRLSMDSQGVSKSTALRKDSAFLKTLGNSEFQQQVISGTNKLTGTNTADITSAMDKKAQQDYDAYEEELIQGEAYASSVLAIQPKELAAASPEQKQEWAQESRIFQAEIAGYKALADVSEDITQPILLSAMAVNSKRMDALLNQTKEKWASGDAEGAEQLANTFRTEVQTMRDEAQGYVKRQMDSVGKGEFYDGSLVSAYASKLNSKLNSPDVQDVLSGKRTDTDATNKAKAIISSAFSKHFLAIEKRIQNGTAVQTDIDDFENYVGHYQSKDITGLSVTGSTFGGTLARATGRGEPRLPPKEKADDQANVLIDMVNSAYGFFKSNDNEEIKNKQNDVAAVIETSIKEGRNISEKNVAWMFDSLKTGTNDTTVMKGKGASKALIEGPLKILTHPEYAAKVAPLVDNYASQGVDVTQVVSQSLDNHIRNNFYNAFINLATSGTTPYSGGTGISIDKNRPSMAAVSGNSKYNLKDDIEIKNTANGIMFSWKTGIAGANTDIGRIKNLQKLNNSTKPINQYLTALSNVSGVDKKEWSESLKVELDSLFGLSNDE
jgi:hypothetical protein